MREAAQPFRLGALVLAAGGSSRMGGAKQLLEIEGRTLIERAVGAALGAHAYPVAVVVGANTERVLAPLAGQEIIAVHNPNWATGLSSSIRAGMGALLAAEPLLDAILVTPCDQPALSRDVILRLADAHRSTGLTAAARYGGRNGAPAVFGRDQFAALCALTGDEGARRLLNADPEKVSAVELPDLGADLDTPADVAAWKSRTR
jgi:molybdenum cofactor cytidylyltransferase